MLKETELVYLRVKYFFLGVLVLLGMIFLMGADVDQSKPVVDIRKYQISAWGDSDAHGAFIVDTITGVTKIVYRYKETSDSKKKEKNNLNKPFVSIE